MTRKECSFITCRVTGNLDFFSLQFYWHSLRPQGCHLTFPLPASLHYLKWAIIKLFYSSPLGYRNNESDRMPLTHFDLHRESCHKNKDIVVIILIELFANGSSWWSPALRYRKENSASSLGYNCLMAIIPITTFPYYCYKRLCFKGRQKGNLKKYICHFCSIEDAEVAHL